MDIDMTITLLNNINRMSYDKEYRDEVMNLLQPYETSFLNKLINDKDNKVIHKWEPI